MTYRFRAALTVLAAVALLASGNVRGADSPAVSLKKGDRIVFLGDSITQGGGGATGYITLIKKALDGPATAITCGHGNRLWCRQSGSRTIIF